MSLKVKDYVKLFNLRMLHIESKLIYNDHVSFVTFVNVKTNYIIKLRIIFLLLFNKHNKRIRGRENKDKLS